MNRNKKITGRAKKSANKSIFLKIHKQRTSTALQINIHLTGSSETKIIYSCNTIQGITQQIAVIIC